MGDPVENPDWMTAYMYGRERSSDRERELRAENQSLPAAIREWAHTAVIDSIEEVPS